MIRSAYPTHRYRLRRDALGARVGRACRTLGRWLIQHRAGLYMAAAMGLWVAAMTIEGEELLAQERQRTEALRVKHEALADWHRQRNVRVTLEGDAHRVADMALQIAAAVRP